MRMRSVFKSLIMPFRARSTLSSVLCLLLVTSMASGQEAKSDAARSASSSAAASSEAAEKSGGVSAADVQNPSPEQQLFRCGTEQKYGKRIADRASSAF